MNKKIVLAGGCFWCTEAVYQLLKGVVSVRSGYANGNPNITPTYMMVCNGDTGYAEAIEIEYDENVISTENILNVFFASHDPTTLNKQGADIGTQYRSAIYWVDEDQKDKAEMIIKEIDAIEGEGKVVTELNKLEMFYPAEDYHQDYYNHNKMTNSYCQVVINPKLAKVQAKYAELLKGNN